VTTPEHRPGCVLDPVHWLRHAVAAAGRLANPGIDDDDDFVDRTSAGALADTLAHFAELDTWTDVTLADTARHATLMADGRFDAMCSCGATA